MDPAVADIAHLQHSVAAYWLLDIQIPLLGVTCCPVLWQRGVIRNCGERSDRGKWKTNQSGVLLARDGNALLKDVIRHVLCQRGIQGSIKHSISGADHGAIRPKGRPSHSQPWS